MQTYCRDNLIEIKQLLIQLSTNQYTHAPNTLFGATIGQHVRHIIEFYQSVLNAYKSGVINYDVRERNSIIEKDPSIAIQKINDICEIFNKEINDELLILEGNFCATEEKQIKVKTSVTRELAYCLEHSIHHQALIKVALLEMNCTHFIDHNFGLAPATIRYRTQCST